MASGKVPQRQEETGDPWEDLNCYDKTWETADAMEKQGGSFVKLLGKAVKVADPVNTRKIMKTWPDYWKQHEEIARKKKQEEK